jgi:Flp pilus assembly protein TadD
MNAVRGTWLVVLAAWMAVVSGCSAGRWSAALPLHRSGTEWETRLDFAQVHEKEGNLRKAEQQLRELHAQHPGDARATHRLGVVLTRLGQIDEGLLLLEEANLSQPGDADVLTDLGYAYVLRGDLDQAEELLRAALAASPRNRRTINNLAIAVGYAGRFDESLALFRQAGSEAEARANLAYVRAQRGEVDAAITEYSRALSQDPGLRPAAEAMVQLAQVQHEVAAGGSSAAAVQWAEHTTADAE